MLRITRPKFAIGGINSLTKTGIGSERNRRNCRTCREHECRVAIIKRSLCDRLQERELRDGKWGCYPSLLLPNDAEPAAHYGPVVNAVSDAEAWSQIQLVKLAGGFGETVDPKVLELLSLKIKNSSLVVQVRRRKV